MIYSFYQSKKAVVDEWVKSAIENILPVIEKFIEKDDADFPPEIFIVAKTVWLRDHYTYYGRLTNADFAVFPSVYHFVVRSQFVDLNTTPQIKLTCNN